MKASDNCADSAGTVGREANIRKDAVRFYERHGFHKTGVKKLEEDTTEYLILLER